MLEGAIADRYSRLNAILKEMESVV
ncbi:MAG: hypothetical protein H6Q30_3151, partial [Bacteroidetes bacterium]|nr:hypothetical protein [Bacteroidota bacterium]